MKKDWLAIAALALGFVCTVHAAEPERAVRPLVGAGLTFGGATLYTVQYNDGTSSNIHAGGLVDVYAGVEFRIAEAFSLQATVGYHVDDRGARNGSLRFERFPIELLGHYRIDPHWRAGGGVRFVQSPRVTGSGVLGGNDVSFDSTTGGVVEGEYLILPASRRVQVGVKLRYVAERYQLQGGGPSISGNHVGVMGSVYF
jgi:hypothetical protein